MLKATLYIQRATGGRANDDVIKVYETTENTDLYRIVYSTPEVKKDSQFHMGCHVASQYFGDLLKSLTYDTEPFEYVQLSTAIHPSVIYHVSDLDDSSIRHMVEDMLMESIRRPVDLVTRR